jgi:hypothetical protein
MFATIVTGDELKRLISSSQNDKLAGSGSANCPDTDGVQPVERTNLTRSCGRMHGTRKPRISACSEISDRRQAKPQGTLMECGLEMTEEAKAIL